MRHFLTLNDFSKDEIIEILNLAFEIKKEAKARNFINFWGRFGGIMNEEI